MNKQNVFDMIKVYKRLKEEHMKLLIIEKDIESTDAIRDYTEKKLERIQKYFDQEIEVEVTLREEGQMKVTQFQVVVGGNTFRSISENEDLYASLDRNVDILERQIDKAKTANRKKMRESIKEYEEVEDVEEIEHEEPVNEIIKYQSYDIRPMDPEDAKLLLSEHRTNNFLTFINSRNNEVNVIFKLKDGKNYGLIVPER